MEIRKQNAVTSSFLSRKYSSFFRPNMPTPDYADNLIHHASYLGTVYPNRIFVGGFDYKVTEGELRHFFTRYGAVKEVKIVVDRAGVSKRYGFVTFENQKDALRILRDSNLIHYKDKKLNIGQAFVKQKTSPPSKNVRLATRTPGMALPMSPGALCMTTSNGFPYTYHNGVAYFPSPNVSPPAPHWPPALPMILPPSYQPVYQPTAYHPYQCVPNQYQWPPAQSPMPSSPGVFQPQPEYMYQPADGGSYLPSPAVAEDGTPPYAEPHVQHIYPVYPLRTEFLQNEPGKHLMFPQTI